jgi:hypothetical protein
MRKFCVALILATGSALVLPHDPAEANGRRVERSVSLAGITPVLVAKTKEIVTACGSVVISAVSPRGIQSNHPIGRAVDLKGNPGCIYAHLKDWPGGYSTDYSIVQHVHISYNPGGQEWGLRFVHGNGTRSARLRNHRMQPLSVFAKHNATYF